MYISIFSSYVIFCLLKIFFTRDQWCQNENMAMFFWFTATNLDARHLIGNYQAHYRQLLFGSYKWRHDQSERLADLDMFYRKYESDLDCDFCINGQSVIFDADNPVQCRYFFFFCKDETFPSNQKTLNAFRSISLTSSLFIVFRTN